MTLSADENLSALSIDYALRLYPTKAAVRPEQIIKDARKLRHFITGERSAKVLKIVKDGDRK